MGMKIFKYILPVVAAIFVVWSLSGGISSSSEKIKTPKIWSASKSDDKDSDKDKLADSEEEKLGTDPQEPDTDGDGFMDGQEVKSGFDPKKAAPGDREGEEALPSVNKPLSFSRNYTNEVSEMADEMVTRYELFSKSYYNLDDEEKTEIGEEVEEFTEEMLKDSGLDFNFSIEEKDILLDEEMEDDLDGYLKDVKSILVKHNLLKKDQFLEGGIREMVQQLLVMSRNEIDWEKVKGWRIGVESSYLRISKLPVNPGLKEVHIGVLRTLKATSILLSNIDESDYFRAFLAAGRADKVRVEADNFSKAVQQYLKEKNE